ncbi:MAG TPA: prolyl oligopeptidase family serine peptidase [Gammaproteobacteria bacterium]|nr:prolyl oligopeptidase family serine peptidase [Gammaproteobacteria bacterium]
MKRAAPGGSWPSPLSVAAVSAAQRRYLQPRLHRGAAYWLESRPEEQGRCVLVRAKDGDHEDLTPPPYSVRNRVHEYGGGAYLLHGDTVYFCNDADQCIHRFEGGKITRLTEPSARRYADFAVDAARARLICVCEEHPPGEAVKNYLAAVSLADGSVAPLLTDRDFVSSSTPSPDGRQLAWLAWDDPQMPWDGSELWLAELDRDGGLKNARRIAGGPEESLFQPRWSPGGVLHFVSDRTGYWNLYRYAGDEIEALCPDAADYGYAQWVLGMSSYGFLSEHEIATVRIERGRSSLMRIAGGKRIPIEAPYTHIEHLDAGGGRVLFLGGAPDISMGIVEGESGTFRRLSVAGFVVDPAYLSRAEAVSFPTSGGETAHAWYYPPRNRDYRTPEGEAPPLIVRCHGGPTAMNGDAMEARIQFWTSRGFAVADLNYRGSTGFGRAYRRSLAGQWGVKDMEDCVQLLVHLAARGLADPKRAAVSGSSAGGFTALATLTFKDAFRGGAIQYGLSELVTAMRDTHKFEARYGDMLLGPWPEAEETYRARSPLYAADRIHVPVIFFQGMKDTVVQPDQTARMLAALREHGVPAACLTFSEEGHGFRRAETLRAVLSAELAFYSCLFGFTPADPVPVLDLGTKP